MASIESLTIRRNHIPLISLNNFQNRLSGNQAPDLLVDFDDATIATLADHVRSIGVPPAMAELPDALQSFSSDGCAACHSPNMQTEDGGSVPLFSDLLLHDMGEALTSYGGEGLAKATEWRTTPLIGFRGNVPGHRYLHDGRAANIDEAIRWHGGEADASRKAYMALSSTERLDLTAYVHSLLTLMPLPPRGD